MNCFSIFLGLIIASSQTYIQESERPSLGENSQEVQALSYLQSMSAADDSRVIGKSVQILRKSDHDWLKEHHFVSMQESLRPTFNDEQRELQADRAANEVVLPARNPGFFDAAAQVDLMPRNQKRQELSNREIKEVADRGAIWINTPWGQSYWQIERPSERMNSLPAE